MSAEDSIPTMRCTAECACCPVQRLKASLESGNVHKGVGDFKRRILAPTGIIAPTAVDKYRAAAQIQSRIDGCPHTHSSETLSTHVQAALIQLHAIILDQAKVASGY